MTYEQLFLEILNMTPKQRKEEVSVVREDGMESLAHVLAVLGLPPGEVIESVGFDGEVPYLLLGPEEKP